MFEDAVLHQPVLVHPCGPMQHWSLHLLRALLLKHEADAAAPTAVLVLLLALKPASDDHYVERMRQARFVADYSLAAGASAGAAAHRGGHQGAPLRA